MGSIKLKEQRISSKPHWIDYYSYIDYCVYNMMNEIKNSVVTVNCELKLKAISYMTCSIKI